MLVPSKCSTPKDLGYDVQLRIRRRHPFPAVYPEMLAAPNQRFESGTRNHLDLLLVG